MIKWLEIIGSKVIFLLEEIGRIVQLFFSTISLMIRPPYRFKHTMLQLEEVGFNSIPVALITATFTGMVLALQSYVGFRRFNAEALVGTVVALSITRELGPVLTGLIVAGRAGSAMAAELGTMRVTEQIDALETMAVNPIKYLVVPRFIASLIALPLLTVFADLVGIIGGFLVSVQMLGANPVVYIRRTVNYMELNDIYSGLLKAAIFGIIIAIVGCYKGFYTKGGAEGVGRATTGAVVLASMLILISDYFLTALLF